MNGWRCAAAALPFVALATGPVAAAEVPVAPAPSSAPALGPGATGASAASPWWSVDLLGPLRAFGVETWWDVVRLSRWTGTLGLTFDRQQQRLTAPGSPARQNSSALASETATLRNDAFAILDPRLFTGSVSAGLTLQQQRQGIDDRSTSQEATLVNYAFDGILLPERAYNASLSALRSQSTYVLPSGATTKSDNQSQGLVLRVRENSLLRDREILPYFSANLGARQQRIRQTTASGDQVFRQDDERDELTFDFHNGGLTSDLDFQYRFIRLDNRAFAQGSYDSQSANLVYSLDFGPTLNRRWDSRINYATRTGKAALADLTTLEVNQYLTIDHNIERSSSYSYQLTRQTTPFGTATAHNGSALVQQQVYANLAVSAGVNGQYTALPGGAIRATGGSASLSYNRHIAWEGQLSAAAGGSDTVTTSEVGGGTVQVRDAPYAVPPDVGAGSSILLADRNIVPATILIDVFKTGARVRAVLDVDYAVSVIGDRTSIVPLSGSAVMLPGDPLYVSYAYLVAVDARFRTTSRSLSFGIDWPRFGFSFSHDESQQTPLSAGDDALLIDQSRDAGKIYVTGTWNTLTGRASVGFLRYDSTRLKYLERRADQYLSYRPYLNLHFNLTANQYQTEYKLPAQTRTGMSLRADATWTWSDRWLTSAYAGTRSYRDSEHPSERIDEAGFRLRRNWAKLNVDVFAGTQRRKRGEVASLNTYVHFGAVRRF